MLPVSSRLATRSSPGGILRPGVSSFVKRALDGPTNDTPGESSHAAQDRRAVAELRNLLSDSAGEWFTMATLRECFPGRRFSLPRKAEVERALVEAGIEVWPSLRQVKRDGGVRLRIVGPPGREATRRQRIEWWGMRIGPRSVAFVVALVGFAASVQSLAPLLFPGGSGHPSPPDAMTGDLNIAVAPFTTNGQATEDGVLLAQAVSQDLRTRVRHVEPGLQIPVRGPGEPGVSSVNDMTALALAQRINADIVLHGSLRQDSTGTTVVARFYLNRTKLPSAGELAGNYTYGAGIRAPFPLTVSPETRAEVRSRLASEADVLATFFVGVGDYLTHRYTPAQKHLSEVLRNAADRDVRALSLVLLGNVVARENEPMRAEVFYAQAARYATTQGRAAYGLAEMQYTTARGTCSKPRANMSGLKQARVAFARVPLGGSRALPADSTALLRAKVEFGLGQVDLCLSQSAGGDSWRRARSEMESVVASYGSNVSELRDDAAEAYAGIGLADLHVRPVDYAAVRAAYTRAGQLTSIPSRRTFFARMAAYADARHGVRN
jgi:hypothetical protein